MAIRYVEAIRVGRESWRDWSPLEAFVNQLGYWVEYVVRFLPNAAQRCLAHQQESERGRYEH
jgi:hypothetical protein